YGARHMWKHVVQFNGGAVEQREQEDAHPPREEENTDGPKVVAILRRKAAAQRFPRPEMVELGVSLNDPRNLERRGAQEADALAHRAVERHHHLGAEENVVACPPARRIGDVVPKEVVAP